MGKQGKTPPAAIEIQKPQTAQTVEETKEGLAPIARKILTEIFRNPNYEKFMAKIKDPYNRIQRGEGTDAEKQSDKQLVKKAIEEELNKINVYGNTADLAGNYYKKLLASLD